MIGEEDHKKQENFTSSCFIGYSHQENLLESARMTVVPNICISSRIILGIFVFSFDSEVLKCEDETVLLGW